jgi:hypothetical protein
MATATIATTRFELGVVMTQPKQLRPELEDIVNDLLALREMAKTGILTHHSQRELVKHLNARDMADVSRAVSLAEKKQQPICARTATATNK